MLFALCIQILISMFRCLVTVLRMARSSISGLNVMQKLFSMTSDWLVKEMISWVEWVEMISWLGGRDRPRLLRGVPEETRVEKDHE